MDRQSSRPQPIRSETKPLIWHWCSNRWYSAITDYAFSACQSLDRQGISSQIFLPKGSTASAAAQRLSIDHITLSNFTVAPLQNYFCQPTARRPHVVVCYGGAETFASRFLPRSVKKIRFIGDMPRGMKNRGAGHLNGIIFPSQTMLEALGSSIARTVIPLGRDTDVFSEHRISDHRTKSLLIVGRLDPVKGHAEFAKIFSAAKEKMCDHELKLRIIGEPKNLSAMDLREAFTGQGLKEGQDFEIVDSLVPRIADEMGRCLLGVIPSLGSEFIVRVAEEFLLCGAPIFTSGVGSLPEVARRAGCMSYSSSTIQDPVAMLCESIRMAVTEGPSERHLRARKAAEEYSWAVMGHRLREFLLD